MVDEPGGDKPTPKSDQRLSVRIEGGGVTIEHRLNAENRAAEPAQPQQNRQQVPWHTSFGRWLLRIRDDPNACVMAFATLTIAAFTIVLACVSIRQWHTIQRQLEDSETVQAAHLAVVEPVTVDVEAYPKISHVKFSIANAGQSLANDIGIIGSGACANDSILGRGPSPNTLIVSQPNPSGGSLVAGNTRPEDMTLILLPHCVDALQRGTTYAFVQIMVSYSDIFGHKRVIAYSTCYSPQARSFHSCIQGQVHD